MSSIDYQLMSNVSREKSFGFGCVIRFTRQCNSSRSSERLVSVESGITIALLRRNTEISSSGFGSARTKITTISSGNCGSRCLLGQWFHRSRHSQPEN